MRITEYVGSDFKHLGKNHLVALGFAAAGFTVAYAVNKACLWFFAEKEKMSKTKELIFAAVACVVSLQANMFLKSITSNLHTDWQPLNARIFALYVTVFAIAAFMNQKKVCMGIGVSAMAAFIHPWTIGDGATAVGSVFGCVRED